MDSSEWDSVCLNQKYKAQAHALLLDVNSDTLLYEDIKYVKGRGNSSWQMQKNKPLTIKLNSAYKLLDLNKGKAFCLLSSDYSMIRNAVAFDIANQIGLSAPKYSYLSLFVNNVYVGRYMITNKISVGRRGVNIRDLDIENQSVNHQKLKEYPICHSHCSDNTVHETSNSNYPDSLKFAMLDFSPDDISGGYFLNIGINGYHKSVSGFISHYGNYVRIESPKYTSLTELEYISDYFNLTEKIIMDLKPDQELRELAQYIDIESFVKYYLLQELLLNVDCGQNSFYMYKDANDIMHAGPIWDFDLSLNNWSSVGTYFLPNEIWMHNSDIMGQHLSFSTSNWLRHLCVNKYFELQVANIYNKEVRPIIIQYLNSGIIDQHVSIISKDAQYETYENTDRSTSTYLESTQNVMDFLHKRLDFLDWYYTTNRNDMVCITCTTPTDESPIYRRFYIPKGTCFLPPQPIFVGGRYLQSPIPVWQYAGTDSIFDSKTKLYNDCSIEIKWNDPSWLYIQYRRLLKIWHKLFD